LRRRHYLLQDFRQMLHREQHRAAEYQCWSQVALDAMTCRDSYHVADALNHNDALALLITLRGSGETTI